MWQQDARGPGYTLCLPLSKNGPDGTQVRLTVRYEQPGRETLRAESGPVTLKYGDG
jgi:hypothetical protein